MKSFRLLLKNPAGPVSTGRGTRELLLGAEQLHHHPDRETDGEECNADGRKICNEGHLIYLSLINNDGLDTKPA